MSTQTIITDILYYKNKLIKMKKYLLLHVIQSKKMLLIITPICYIWLFAIKQL